MNEGTARRQGSVWEIVCRDLGLSDEDVASMRELVLDIQRRLAFAVQDLAEGFLADEGGVQEIALGVHAMARSLVVDADPAGSSIEDADMARISAVVRQLASAWAMADERTREWILEIVLTAAHETLIQPGTLDRLFLPNMPGMERLW